VLLKSFATIAFSNDWRIPREIFFEPLGMKISFYLTPELKDHLITLSLWEADGKLINQIPLIERDPSKGLSDLSCTTDTSLTTFHSSCPFFGKAVFILLFVII
jgi:hypothetical protein